MAFGIGYSPVTRVQENIANRVQGGLSNLGQIPLDKARMGLQEASMMHNIARDKRADERADRSLGIREDELGIRQDELGLKEELQEHRIGLENNQEERLAQAAMRNQWEFNNRKPEMIAARKRAEMAGKDLDQMVDLRNQHLDGKSLALFYLGPNASRETLQDFVANDKLNQIARATGATIESVNGELRFKKQDGSYATWFDMPKITPIANDILQSGIDPVLKVKQKIREYDKLAAQGGGTPEQHEEYLRMKEVVKNPQWQQAAYQKLQDADYEKVVAYKKRGMDTTAFELNIARRNEKMGKIQAKVTATATQAGKERIEKIKAAGKNLGTLEKDATFLADVSGITEAEAANIIRADKTMAQSLRGASEEIDLLDPIDYDTPEDLAAAVAKIKMSWGIDTESLRKRREAKPSKTTDDPDGIRQLLFK